MMLIVHRQHVIGTLHQLNSRGLCIRLGVVEMSMVSCSVIDWWRKKGGVPADALDECGMKQGLSAMCSEPTGDL